MRARNPSPQWKRRRLGIDTMHAARRTEVDKAIWERRKRRQRVVDLVRETHRRMTGEGA